MFESFPLGTDPLIFHPGLDPRPFSEANRLPPGRWLLTVARLVPHKGIDTTIRALGLISPRFPDLRYAVVGRGGELGALAALARQEGVDDRVHFLTGITDKDLPLAYALATIYVGVSRQTAKDVEGFGISLLEAEASGKPVVAGRSGGMPDAVQDGETGVLADPEDPGSVASAIAEFLEHPERAERFGKAGREAVERFFNWPRVVSDLRGLSAEARSARR